MATESIHMPVEQNLDYQMLAHFIDGLKREQKFLTPMHERRLKMHDELKDLKFWR